MHGCMYTYHISLITSHLEARINTIATAKVHVVVAMIMTYYSYWHFLAIANNNLGLAY